MIQERVVSTFLDLVQIDSPSTQEHEVAAYVKRWADRLGLACHEDGTASKVGGTSGNLLIQIPGLNSSGSPLMLSTHMDVVEPCRGVKPRILDGMIHSDGTTVLGADAKASLAAILDVVETVVEQRVAHPPLELVITVCEEMGLVGSSHFDVAALASTAGLVVDSQLPVGAVIAAAPTEYKFDAVIHGRPAHAGIEPEKGVSAAVIAAEAIHAIAWGRLDLETTANIGMIHGGTGTNVVMPKLHMQGETRSFNRQKIEERIVFMERTFRSSAQAHGATLEWTVRKSYEGYRFEASHPLVERIRRHVEALQLPFDFRASGGGSDANVFNARGLPTVVLGYGPKKIHTCEESMAVKDLQNLCTLLTRLISDPG